MGDLLTNNRLLMSYFALAVAALALGLGTVSTAKHAKEYCNPTVINRASVSDSGAFTAPMRKCARTDAPDTRRAVRNV